MFVLQCNTMLNIAMVYKTLVEAVQFFSSLNFSVCLQLNCAQLSQCRWMLLLAVELRKQFLLFLFTAQGEKLKGKEI